MNQTHFNHSTHRKNKRQTLFTFTQHTAEHYIPLLSSPVCMSSQMSVRSTFANDLDGHQRNELWEYNRELRQLGFPTKLRWELVDEYEAMLRARQAMPSIDRID